jgi:hypothetical protein
MIPTSPTLCHASDCCGPAGQPLPAGAGQEERENPACRFGFYYSRAAPVLYDYIGNDPPPSTHLTNYIYNSTFDLYLFLKKLLFFCVSAGHVTAKGAQLAGIIRSLIEPSHLAKQ